MNSPIEGNKVGGSNYPAGVEEGDVSNTDSFGNQIVENAGGTRSMIQPGDPRYVDYGESICNRVVDEPSTDDEMPGLEPDSESSEEGDRMSFTEFNSQIVEARYGKENDPRSILSQTGMTDSQAIEQISILDSY